MVCTCIFNSLMAAMAIIYTFVFLIGGVGLLTMEGTASGEHTRVARERDHDFCGCLSVVRAALLSVMKGLGGLAGGSTLFPFAAICCIEATASCAAGTRAGLLDKGNNNAYGGGGVTMVMTSSRRGQLSGGPKAAMGPGAIVVTDKANFSNI